MGNFTQAYHSDLWAFAYTSQAQFTQSLWPGFHLKILKILHQNVSVRDANFGQRWQRKKWNKAQTLSQPVISSTGVNGLKIYSKVNVLLKVENSLFLHTTQVCCDYILKGSKIYQLKTTVPITSWLIHQINNLAQCAKKVMSNSLELVGDSVLHALYILFNCHTPDHKHLR